MNIYNRIALGVFLILTKIPAIQNGDELMNDEDLNKATFGGGCFWCVEAVFERINGVTDVVSGYAGGHSKYPTYTDVISGKTGHAEVCQITFDRNVVSYDELLNVFWQVHDPTSLNRQGADVGTQYRSVIYYHNKEQEQLAKTAVNIAQKIFSEPIQTEVKPLDQFYLAEMYHQNYYAKNPNDLYCIHRITPKINELDNKGLFDK